MINIVDFQDDINDIAVRFVDVLERGIIATGNDPVELEAAGQTIIAAIGAALDAEKAKRFARPLDCGSCGNTGENPITGELCGRDQ